MGKGTVLKTENNVKKIALEVLKMAKDEEKKQAKKKVLHNIELLLNHYHQLIGHKDNAIYQSKEPLEEEIDFDILLDDIKINSILRSKSKTITIIAHINVALDLLKDEMLERKQFEKYEVIKFLYLDRETVKIPWGERITIAAERLHCSDDSIGRWRKEMIKELSVFMFGIDGLKIFTD